MPRAWLLAFSAALALMGLGIALGEPVQALLNGAAVCLACLGVG